MAHWSEDGALRSHALAPFGIEIDTDLSKPLSEAAAAEFVTLFRDQGLILARRQRLTMERQREILALLGPILLREGESGYLSTVGAHAASLSELKFHSDAAYTDHPFDALALHAVDVVDGASSTRFVHAEQGCAALPAALRRQLAAARVEMISPHYETLAQRSCDLREPRALRRGEYPGIFINPHTDRPCVRVSEMHAARVNGMAWEDSHALLVAVFDHLYAPENILEHVWHQGDIVIWDNIALQHARGPLAGAGRRVLQRVIVGTEGVCPHIAMAG
jgi:taurine dioxygenase